jgi:hypothetical protein
MCYDLCDLWRSDEHLVEEDVKAEEDEMVEEVVMVLLVDTEPVEELDKMQKNEMMENHTDQN